MKHIKIIYAPLLLLTACGSGNPGDISDAYYAEYKELSAPKILYSCFVAGTESSLKAKLASIEICSEIEDIEDQMDCILEPNVYYRAGVGLNSTYNRILIEVKNECISGFEILESEQ